MGIKLRIFSDNQAGKIDNIYSLCRKTFCLCAVLRSAYFIPSQFFHVSGCHGYPVPGAGRSRRHDY